MDLDEIYAKKCGHDFEVITDYIGKLKHKIINE